MKLSTGKAGKKLNWLKEAEKELKSQGFRLKATNNIKERIGILSKLPKSLENTETQLEKIDKMFESLFDLYYDQVSNNNKKEDIYTMFLNGMSQNYNENTTTARKVIDYISGMTDNFFIEQYKKYFLV